MFASQDKKSASYIILKVCLVGGVEKWEERK